MNKTQYFLMLTLCFSKTICFLEPDTFPPDSISLVKGFFETSGLREVINISKCESEFNGLVFKIAILLDKILDDKDVLADIGLTFIDLSAMKNKCNDNDFGKSKISPFIHKAIIDPQKFLLAVLDNLLSFHIAGKYIELKGNLKDKRMHEAGRVLGDIAKYILNINFDNNLVFLIETKPKDCSDSYREFVQNVYSILISNINKPTMPLLLEKLTSLIKNCK